MQTSNHAAHDLTCHIILTTKFRRRCINAAMLERLREVFVELCASWRCRLIEFSGEGDHVHLLVSAHPAMNLSVMIANLKTASARRIRKEFPEHLAKYYWKPSSGTAPIAVVSAGGHASIEQLVAYIQNQEQPSA